MNVCPQDVDLIAYGLGRLSGSLSDVVKTHLVNCRSCVQRLALMSSNSFDDSTNQSRASGGKDVPVVSFPSQEDGHRPLPVELPIGNLPVELLNNSQYSDIRELGRGGMGVVYLALNRMMNRREVLKLIDQQRLERPGARERFIREVRSAARLNHPNVVMAYSAMESGATILFAMEYVPGEDLAQVVKNKGPLEIRHACHYVAQVAMGLQHAHEKGMVHRDIKPANLILSREDRKSVVKILDFGLAKISSEQGADTGLTREGQMMGTPDFVAPEQAIDAATADIRADIYSLGCTLYFLLAGHPPFRAKSLFELLQAHQRENARPLNLLRPEVPAELAEVVSKLMAKDPAKRYQTPAQVALALKPFLARGTTQKVTTESPLAISTEKRSPIASPLPLTSVTAKSRKNVPIAKPAPVRSVEGESITDEAVPPHVDNPEPFTQKLPSKRRWMALTPVSLVLIIIVAWAVGLFATKKPNEIERDVPVAEVPLPAEPPAKPSELIEKAPPVVVIPKSPPIDLTAHEAKLGRWKNRGNELFQETGNGPGRLNFGSFEWEDYDVEFEVQKISGFGEIGLCYRVSDSQCGVFTIGKYDGTWQSAVVLFADGKRDQRLRERKTVSMNQDEWYKMRVRVRVSNVRCFLDDQLCLEFTDNDNIRGAVGIWTWKTPALFRNFRVTDPKGVKLWEGTPKVSN